MNDVLHDRPLTWQEALLAGVLGLLMPGAGFALAALAAAMAFGASQRGIAIAMLAIMAWNIVLIAILLGAV